MLDQLLATPGSRNASSRARRSGSARCTAGSSRAPRRSREAAAVASGASFYAVVQPDDLRWHVPSHSYDPALSDGLRAFLAHVDVVISVHGFGGVRDADDRWTTALLGGDEPRARGRARRRC